MRTKRLGNLKNGLDQTLDAYASGPRYRTGFSAGRRDRVANA
jgi:hypothetical protein